MDEATARPRYPRTSAGLRLARQSLAKPVTIDQILDIEDEELDRLRTIEAAARALIHSSDDEELALARAALHEAFRGVPSDAR